MKKVYTLSLFLILLVIPLISSIQIDMNNNFKQGETLIAKVSGNFLNPLTDENIYFFRRGVMVPFEFKLLKIGQDYFIYAPTLGKEASNYSLVIGGLEYYTIGDETSTKSVIKNFTLSSDYADFYTTPGVIIINNSLVLKVENLKDSELTIYLDEDLTQENSSNGGFFSFFSSNSEESPNGESYTLGAGEAKDLSFKLSNLSAHTFKNIQLKSQNFSQDIVVYIDSPIPEINESEYVEINETNTTGINQTENNQSENNKTNPPQKTCEELNGTICKVGKEVCEADTISASNTDSCCSTSCKKKEKSSTGKIIGFSIIGLLVLIYLWFYFKKFKKAKKPVNLLDIAEGKDKKRLERINKRIVKKRR